MVEYKGTKGTGTMSQLIRTKKLSDKIEVFANCNVEIQVFYPNSLEDCAVNVSLDPSTLTLTQSYARIKLQLDINFIPKGSSDIIKSSIRE
jgi:hypothetical protein